MRGTIVHNTAINKQIKLFYCRYNILMYGKYIHGTLDTDPNGKCNLFIKQNPFY